MDLKTNLDKLSKLKYEDIGSSEENVKQKIAVPLLGLLGHHRNDLDFEYGSRGKRIDIFIKGLPTNCGVVIDTKRYNEDLSNHIEQIGNYAYHEGAILALMINGEEIRIYSPARRGFKFEDSLIFLIKREKLAEDKSIEILKGLLLKENILNKSSKQFIIRREEELQEANDKVEQIKKEAQKQIEEIESIRKKAQKQIEETQENIKELSIKIEKIKEEEKENIQSIQQQYQLIQESNQTFQRIKPYEMQEYRARNVFSKSADKIEVNLNAPSYIKYSVIPFPKETRHLFPGFKVKFELETDVGLILTKVTSASAGTKYGDSLAGNYIQGGLKRWFDSHPELKEGATLILSVIEPKKRYSLSIK